MNRKDKTTSGWQAKLLSLAVILLLATCQAANASTSYFTPGTTSFPKTSRSPSPTAAATGAASSPGLKDIPPASGLNSSEASTITPAPGEVPNFSHVIVFIMENKEYTSVIGSSQMPFYNSLADKYALLTHYFATTHPSLPNYISLIGGDTLGITSDCSTCWVNGANLADAIEAKGLTWRTYQEDMPAPCYQGNTTLYAQRHDPFIYFDDIRTNTARCQQGIVPLTSLSSDLANNTLPNFSLIVPNLCNSSHDCSLSVTDAWLKTWVTKVMDSPAYEKNTLIVLTWDEGQSSQTCCGFSSGGGRVATVLVSPLAKQSYRDNTPYSQYSLLKTIAESWGLQQLGHTADPQVKSILAPFEKTLDCIPLLGIS